MAKTPFKRFKLLKRGKKNVPTEEDDGKSLSTLPTGGPSSDTLSDLVAPAVVDGCRKVTFDERFNEYHETPPVYMDELDEMWYDSPDLCEMKENFNLVITIMNQIEGSSRNREDEHSYGNVMERVYGACCCCCSCDQEMQETDGATKESSSPSVLYTPAESLLEEMAVQCREWLPRTGIEHLASRRYRKDKKKRRVELIQLVCDLPRQHPTLSDQQMAEKIRSECLLLTRPAQMFAECVAKARIQAAAGDEQ